jgi:hypothetical protein
MCMVITGIVLASLLPFAAYKNILGQLDVAAHPLRALRDCSVSADTRPRQTRVYLAYADLRSHSFYYYLRGVGPWTADLPIDTSEVRQHLPPANESILVLPRDDYRRFSRNLIEMSVVTSEGDPLNTTSVALPAFPHVVLLLSGALQRCSGAMNAAKDGVQTRVLRAVD